MSITSLFMTAPDFSALLRLMLIKSIHKLFLVQQIIPTAPKLHFSVADFRKLCQISTVFPAGLEIPQEAAAQNVSRKKMAKDGLSLRRIVEAFDLSAECS